MLYSRFPLASYFTFGSVYIYTYINPTLSIRPTLSFLHCVHKLFFMSVSLFQPCKLQGLNLTQRFIFV